MHTQAQETNDYYKAQHAFVLASESISWIFEAFEKAQKTSADLKLIQEAYDTAHEIRNAIMQACNAARKIAETEPDPEVALAVEFLPDSCEVALVQIRLPAK